MGLALTDKLETGSIGEEIPRSGRSPGPATVNGVEGLKKAARNFWMLPPRLDRKDSEKDLARERR